MESTKHLGERCREHQRRIFSVREPAAFSVLSFRAQERYEESEAMSYKVITIVRETFGKSDPMLAAALNNCAMVLKIQVRPSLILAFHG